MKEGFILSSADVLPRVEHELVYNNSTSSEETDSLATCAEKWLDDSDELTGVHADQTVLGERERRFRRSDGHGEGSDIEQRRPPC